jgi:radical SAM superfamily enzyme YgiQ (UPF0313 family)
LDRVAEEVTDLIERWRVPRLLFHDAALTYPPDRMRQLCRVIREATRSEPIDWWAQGRVEDVSRELLTEMADAGCRGIEFGVESASPAVRRAAGKRFENDALVEAVANAWAVGISYVSCSFIIGLPGETVDSARQSIELAAKLRRLGAASTPFAPLIPYPGTPIGDTPSRFGVRIHSRDWSKYIPATPVISTETLDRSDIRQLCFEAWSSLLQGVNETA